MVKVVKKKYQSCGVGQIMAECKCAGRLTCRRRLPVWSRNHPCSPRRHQIVEDLADILPDGCLISEKRGLVPFETDAFIAYRQVPLAVALPETTAQVAAVLKYCSRYGIPVVPRGGRHVPVRRRHPAIGRRGHRPVEDVAHSRYRFCQPHSHGAGGGHQYQYFRSGLGQRLLLCAGSKLAAGLYDRRQYRHEFRRRPLPEIWRHHQQSARREDGAVRRHNNRAGRQGAGCAGL